MLEKPNNNEEGVGLKLFPPESITTNHNIKEFNCDDLQLNKFLRKAAKKDQNHNNSMTYVIVDSKSNRVIAYFTLVIKTIKKKGIKTGLLPGAYDEIPVILLARLAVDNEFKRKSIGKSCISYAFEKCLLIYNIIKFRAIIVNPKNNGIISYYTDLGFQDSGIANTLLFNMSKLSNENLNFISGKN